MRGARAPLLGPVVTATSAAFQLAEGPVWDEARQELLWVDIAAQAAFVGRLDDLGQISVVETVECGGPVSAVALTTEGDWLLAVRDRLVRRTRGGVESDVVTLASPAGSPFAGSRRANDAKVDPWGRLVVGTLDPESEDAVELLLRVEEDSRIVTLDDDLRLSNGMAWSCDGSVFFSVDSLRRCVFRRPYSRDRTGPREVHVEFAEGLPDGICVDEEDHLWVAMWGVGEVQRFDPSGELVAVLRVPAPHPTSVAFAGADREVLVITTATAGLSEEELVQNPLSGRLFTFDAGLRGAPGEPTFLGGQR